MRKIVLQKYQNLKIKQNKTEHVTIIKLVSLGGKNAPHIFVLLVGTSVEQDSAQHRTDGKPPQPAN